MNKTTGKLVALMLVLFVASSVCEVALTPVGVERGYMVRSEGSQPSSEAVSHAFGEFRIVAANLIWLNVIDRYHHEFMEQGGDWAKNVAILPYLQMITWLDPHFIEAYDVASTILAHTKQYGESKKVLIQGIAVNEESWQLYYDLAMLDAWYRNDARHALPFAREALSRCDNDDDKRRLRMLVKTLSDDVRTGQPAVRNGVAPPVDSTAGG